MKNLYLSFLSVIFVSVLSAQPVTTKVIPKPSQLRCSDVPAKLNSVILGATPPNSEQQPVIVFVHGWFDNGYAWFMAKNKWYEKCYNAGYKSAFFFHSYSDEFEKNGRVIAEMIRQTCRHYNTNKVIAVCHSKGGFDIEWALYNEGLADSVQGVITLSTPYWGAPMSDLIANPFIRPILEAIPIVGPVFQGKGSYQMQTAYMAGVVRPMMDNHPQNQPEKFHCYAAWGMNHTTVLPDAIPDDILKVVFRDYQPLCLDIPGFGKLAGDLMSAGMSVIGSISRLVQVQPKYDNPSRNQQYLDGLAPYYSSIRPGAVNISEPPPSQQSNLNHIDVLLSSYMWDIVQPEIEYFKTNPVLRKAPLQPQEQLSVQAFQPYSDVQFEQGNELLMAAHPNRKLYVVGDYSQEVQVTDIHGKILPKLPLYVSTKSLFDVVHEVDLSAYPQEALILKSTTPLTAFIQDGSPAAIQLHLPEKQTYEAQDVQVKVSLAQWPQHPEQVNIQGFLTRNMDAQGELVSSAPVALTFYWEEKEQAYMSKAPQQLDAGVYNISVTAAGNDIKRFATSSILVKSITKNVVDASMQLTVFPNPATDRIAINVETATAGNYTLQFTDVQGRLLATLPLSYLASGKQEVSVSVKQYQLPAGMCWITLTDVSGKVQARQSVVIQ